MSGIGIEETASVGSHHLNDFLGSHGTLRNELLAALKRGYLSVGIEVLRHALPDEDKTHDDGYGQQYVQRAAREIDPEIADSVRRAACEAADKRNRKRNAGRRRNEIMDRKPGHLYQIAHCAFRRVGLPVRIGDEADRGVEGEVRRYSRQSLRVEGQSALQPL